MAPLDLSAAEAPTIPGIPFNASAGELRVQIDRASETAAQLLSPQSHEAQRRSLTRFYEATIALCGDPDRPDAPDGARETCQRNQYANYLAHVPESIYRVDGIVVYETGIYGVQWADEDLQQGVAERANAWRLRVTWPRVDTPPDNPSNPLSGPVKDALERKVHSWMSKWITGLWEVDVAVRIESLSRCYVSARIETSWYGGGAHPSEGHDVFNWNRLTNRPLADSEFFRADSGWREGLSGLYRKHLGDAARGLENRDLAPWVQHGYVVTGTGLTIVGHEGRSRSDQLPDVKLPWAELAPWISSAAKCGASSPGQGL